MKIQKVRFILNGLVLLLVVGLSLSTSQGALAEEDAVSLVIMPEQDAAQQVDSVSTPQLNGGWITGVTAQASGVVFPNALPSNLVDDAGLSETAPGSGIFTLTDNAEGVMWNSNYFQGLATLVQFDLGAPYTVNRFHVWNYNNGCCNGSTAYPPGTFLGRGVREAFLQYSLDGSTWQTAPQLFLFPKAPGTANYTGTLQTITTPITARYIRLRVNRTWTGNRHEAAGLGKVRFFAGNTPTGQPLLPTIFPADANVINVKDAPYYAKGDGNCNGNDYAAIQQAILDHLAMSSIIYLPNGTYCINQSISLPTGWQNGWISLRGESQAGTIIRLRDNTFTAVSAPMAAIQSGYYVECTSSTNCSFPNNSFGKYFSDFTINTGSGNLGAIGLSYHANNVGSLRHITIQSQDGNGEIGLQMDNPVSAGPLLVKGLTVIGFKRGITFNTGWWGSATLEDIQLQNQRVLALDNGLSGGNLSIRNLTTVGQSQVISNNGHIVLVDATLQGTGLASSKAAITNHQVLFARNIRLTGYQISIDNRSGSTPSVTNPVVDEFVSHPTVSVFPSSPRSLNLAARDTPTITRDLPASWVNILNSRQITESDDSAAFQRAIDSGATTLYVPVGTHLLITGTIILRNNLRHIDLMHAKVVPVWDQQKTSYTTLRVEDGNAPVVVLDNFAYSDDFSYGGYVRPTYEQITTRTVVLRDSIAFRTLNVQRGDLLIEDLAHETLAIAPGARVWARQLNPENIGRTKITNNGGSFWGLGVKSEGVGTEMWTTAGGKSEILGGLQYVTWDSFEYSATAWFVNEDSSVSVSMAGITHQPLFFHPYFRDTRQGQTQSRNGDPATSTFIALYTGYHTLFAPSNLTATATAINQLSLRWTDNTNNETGFKIERCSAVTCTNFVPIASVSANITTYVDSGLVTGTTYRYQVRATENTIDSLYSNIASAVSINPPPGAPTNLTIPVTSSTLISLTWVDNANNETGFKIERCIGVGCNSFTQIAMVGANITTYANSGLVAGTSYSYRVRAYHATASSDYSNVVSAVPLPPLPLAPSNLQTTLPANTQINLAWTDNSTNETGFKIERCQGANCTNFTRLFTTTANISSYANPGLPVDTAYCYRVRAYNLAGDSPYSNVACRTTGVLPPSNLFATRTQATETHLYWLDNASNETGFRVERCTGSGCTTFVQLVSLAVNVVGYRDVTLAANTTYRYRIVAYNAGGSSSPSNIVDVTTSGIVVASEQSSAMEVATSTEAEIVTFFVPAQGQLVVEHPVTCSDNTQPTTVTLLVGETRVPMTKSATQEELYLANLTLSEQFTSDSQYLLRMQWHCLGEEMAMEADLGVLQVTSPESNPDLTTRAFLPLINR